MAKQKKLTPQDFELAWILREPTWDGHYVKERAKQCLVDGFKPEQVCDRIDRPDVENYVSLKRLKDVLKDTWEQLCHEGDRWGYGGTRRTIKVDDTVRGKILDALWS
jgi:hypothetical protein